MTIREAIECLEFKKHVCQNTAPYKWTESEEIALSCLTLIDNQSIEKTETIREVLRSEYDD